MKKILIPAILATTVLVAGMFAFMPIEKASTIHTSLGGGKNTVDLLFTGGAALIPAGSHIVLVDNMGTGPTVSAEITWEIADAACEVRTVTGGVLSAALTDDAALDVLLDASINHRDVANVDGILLRGQGAVCDVVAGDYVTVTLL